MVLLTHRQQEIHFELLYFSTDDEIALNSQSKVTEQLRIRHYAVLNHCLYGMVGFLNETSANI